MRILRYVERYVPGEKTFSKLHLCACCAFLCKPRYVSISSVRNRFVPRLRTISPLNTESWSTRASLTVTFLSTYFYTSTYMSIACFTLSRSVYGSCVKINQCIAVIYQLMNIMNSNNIQAYNILHINNIIYQLAKAVNNTYN